MRLFTGISLPDDVIVALTRLIEKLQPTAHVKWSPAYNLHITTKFIGHWPEGRFNELLSVLKEMPKPGAIPIDVNGVGWFPNPHAPRVLFAAVHAPESLAQLAVATDEALSAIGIERETKKFRPHLTLARIKDATVPLTPLKKAIAELASVDLGSFTVDRFHLFRSTPGPSASIYTQLADIPLIKT